MKVKVGIFLKTQLVVVFMLLSLGHTCGQRQFHTQPFTDTTSTSAKGIIKFWRDYINNLNDKNVNSGFMLKSLDPELQSYWTDEDRKDYNFCDLYYSIFNSFGSCVYTFSDEYFFGANKRTENEFEIKTMFVTGQGIQQGFPQFIITVPIIKTRDGYKLQNWFTKNKNLLNIKKYNNITYCFDKDYSFNDSLANLLDNRIQDFKKGFKIDNNIEINYMVANNLSEIYKWFGIDYISSDYMTTTTAIEGRYSKLNNMVLSGGGGENYLHEIIHALLEGLRGGKYYLFEEGIAVYFGEHLGKLYKQRMPEFKLFVQKNAWMNFSKSLFGYSKDGENIYYTEIIKEIEQIPYKDLNSEYNFQYMIHAVLCEIAFEVGGYDKVKELLFCKADNEQEFYNCIEQVLKIKQEDLNTILRNFIEGNY